MSGLALADLENNFYPVEALSNGLVRCGDELPARTIHTYFKLVKAPDFTPFVTSDDIVDDAFAALVLEGAPPSGVESLTKSELPVNAYGFTHVLYAPHGYHSELMGRLDAQRPQTTLCIPIYAFEFSGAETVEEFLFMRRAVVSTQNWRRSPAPKILLRFDNPHTGGGTGDGYVLAKFDLLEQEARNLRDSGGFIELLNHRGQVVELLASGDDFSWIRDRDDASAITVAATALSDRLRNFLTA